MNISGYYTIVLFGFTQILPYSCYDKNVLRAQDAYHKTTNYIKYQELKQKLEQDKTLEKLDQQFVDLKRKCEEKTSTITIFRRKQCPVCLEAAKIYNQFLLLKTELNELEENASNTQEGKEYFTLLLNSDEGKSHSLFFTNAD